MSPKIPDVLPDLRRIVTTHNDEGFAVFQTDSQIPTEPLDGNECLRAGAIWVTADSVPTNDNNTSEDGAARKVQGIVEPRGTNFRYTDLAPGEVTPMHRTNSIDYNILIQGEIILITDDGAEKHLTTCGDTVIQKGTLHAWKNPGKTWTRWVTVIIAAEPAIIHGKPLEPAWLS